MNLNRRQLSFLITFFAMGLVVLSMYTIHLGKQKEEDEYFVEILTEEDLEKIIEEEEKELSKELAQADPIESHKAYNETSKPSYGNPEPLKTLDELMQEQADEIATEGKDYLTSDNGYAARVKALAKKREQKKQLLGERDAQKTEYTNNLAKRKTSVSYSLVDRNAYALPPPIYTCIEGGKVVINITVNNEGQVVKADFNSKSSSTSNGCLVDNAIAYALKARFNAASKEEQIGSITYVFQSK